MSEKKKASTLEADQLVQEGARSYPEAIIAMAAFRCEVYKRCTAMVIEEVDALTAAIGDTITKEHVQPYYKNETWSTDTEAYLTVKVQSPNMTRLEFYTGVGWWEEDNGDRCFSVDAGFWVPSKARESLKTALMSTWKQGNLLLWDDDGIWIASKIHPDDACIFPERLKELFGIWAAVGRKYGGVRKVVMGALPSED